MSTIEQKNRKHFDFEFDGPREPMGIAGFVFWATSICLCLGFWTYIIKTLIAL